MFKHWQKGTLLYSSLMSKQRYIVITETISVTLISVYMLAETEEETILFIGGDVETRAGRVSRFFFFNLKYAGSQAWADRWLDRGISQSGRPWPIIPIHSRTSHPRLFVYTTGYARAWARVYFVVLHISSSMFKTNSIYNSTELHNIHYCVRVPPNRQINQEYVNHKIQQNKINN